MRDRLGFYCRYSYYFWDSVHCTVQYANLQDGMTRLWRNFFSDSLLYWTAPIGYFDAVLYQVHRYSVPLLHSWVWLRAVLKTRRCLGQQGQWLYAVQDSWGIWLSLLLDKSALSPLCSQIATALVSLFFRSFHIVLPKQKGGALS